jgi:hypothetical protein
MSRKDINPMTITDKHRGFSPTYDRLRERLKISKEAFTLAVDECDDTPAQLELIKHLFGDLVKAIRHADTCKGELDPPERQRLARFLANTAEPTIEYWRDVLDAVDDGASLGDALVAMDQRYDLDQ